MKKCLKQLAWMASLCAALGAPATFAAVSQDSVSQPSVTEIAGLEKVSINSASAEELTRLKGIGPAKAAAIVAYRDSSGPFQSVEQLVEVKGIGSRTLERLRSQLQL